MRIAVASVIASMLFAATFAAEPAPAHDDFAGTWSGKVFADHEATEIGFAFRPSKAGLHVVFSMPAMAVNGAPLGPAEFDRDEFVFPGLDTRLRREGDALVGTFAIPALRVELHRAAELPRAEPRPAFPAGPAPAWSVTLGGQVWGSPIVSDGVAYVATTAGAVHARRIANGEAAWISRGDAPYYSTPAISGDTVYLVNGKAELVALSAADGRQRWRCPLFNPHGPPATLPDNPTFNHRTPTPVFADGRVYVGSPDGDIYVVDATTGQVTSRIPIGAPIYGTVSIEDRRLACGAMDGTVCVVELDTHAVRARTKVARAVVSAPVTEDGTLVVGARDYMLYGFDRDTLARRWRHSFWFSWVESTPAVREGVMYIGGSDYARVTAFEPKFDHVLWQTRVYGLTWGTPVVTTDSVYVGTHAQREALIPHEAALLALDRATGAVRWRIAIPSDGAERTGVLGSLAGDGEHLFAALFDGTLHMYRL